MKVDRYNVKIRLTEDVLGTVPKNKQVFTSFLLDRARKEAKRLAEKNGTPHASGEPVTEESLALMEVETETVQQTEERGWTGFHTDPTDGPFVMDYAIKGFLKEAARNTGEWDTAGDDGGGEGEEEADEKPAKKGAKKGPKPLKQLQDKFSRHVYVLPRKVYFYTRDELAQLPHDEQGNLVLGNIERPLRAITAQGPRITVVRSDLIPAGRELSFQIHVRRGKGISRALLEEILSDAEYQGLGQWRSGGYGRFELVSLTPY